MARISETITYVVCDVCKNKEIPSKYKGKQYIINEKIWDICFSCCPKLDMVLSLLNIDHRIRGGKSESE